MEFVRADELVKRTVSEFVRWYILYDNDIIDYKDVLDYVDNNVVIKDLFIKYVLEKVRDELENTDLSDFVNLKGVFCPFSGAISEVIDGFVDWLKLKGYL